MSERMLWFERKFSFDLPVWMFPNVLERLRGTPVRVAERARAFPREVLTVRDGDGWSMQEQAGHLLDLEPLGFDRLEDYLAGAEVLRPADLQNRKTHEARHNERAIEEILEALTDERVRFVARLEELDEEMIVRESVHPRLQKPMRLLDLLFFIAEHDDHHIAKMTRLGRKLSGARALR